jgi:hypothetical protein
MSHWRRKTNAWRPFTSQEEVSRVTRPALVLEAAMTILDALLDAIIVAAVMGSVLVIAAGVLS